MQYSQGGFMLGQNIKKVRQKKKLTQDTLARIANIPYTSITKIETGVIKKPSVQSVAKIAKALGVSIDELMEGV
jgi:transcriptional regulator with XRE-family HTH domain